MNLSGGFAAGAGADALEGLLTRLFRENEAKQRTRQEQQRIEQDDRRLKMMEADRQAGAADVAKSRAVQNALRISGTMLPGTSLTPDTVGALRTGEMGNLVKHEEADIPSRAISGIASAGAKAPIMGSLRMAAAGRPERDTFTGTADQLAADQARTDRLAATAEATTAKVDAAKQATLDRTEAAKQRAEDQANLVRLTASLRPPPQTINFGTGSTPAQQVQTAATAIREGRMSPSQATSMFGGFGKEGQQFKRAVMEAVQEQDPSFNFAQAESGYQFGKNTGTQTTVRMIDNISKSLPILEKASDDFDRSGVRLINKAILAGKDQFGDTKVSTFQTARLGLADEIAKILSGGGTGSVTSDAKLKQANELLAGDMTPAQLKATTSAVRELLANRRQSLTSGTFMEKKEGGGKPSETPEQRIQRLLTEK